MRPLEVLTHLILAVYLLYPLTGKKRPPAVGILPAFALVTIATHAQAEGMRWQMIPLYAFTVTAFFLSIPTFFRAGQNKTPNRRPFRIILNLSLLAVSTALPILLPVPLIPVPNGPQQVGTRIYELTDTSRKELYSGKDEARRIQIQVWYPSEPSPTDQRAPWMQHADIYSKAISGFLELPSFFLSHLALVKTPAFQDSPVAAPGSAYPIILFSHGWQGFAAQNSGQAIELASQGYVVIAVQHTYGAIITVFNDGTIADYNPSALPDGAPRDEYEVAAHKLADQWSGDLGFALDIMEAQNKDTSSPFFTTLDPSRVGVYGHSTGGGAAIQFCATDTRCKALLGMDPFMRPVSYQVINSGISQPAFFLFSQRWTDDVKSRTNELFNRFYPNVKDPFGAVTITGTAHHDFSDLPLLSPIASQLGLKGPINGKRVTIIMNDYLLSFFNKTLKGIPSDLFDDPSRYPEIKPKQ